MMKNNRMYVAGPLNSSGDRLENVHAAIEVGEQLIELGFIPFIPHLYHYWDLHSEHSSGYWLTLDRAWLETCGALVRIPGISIGADIEVDWARDLGIPVFMGIERVRMVPEEIRRNFILLSNATAQMDRTYAHRKHDLSAEKD